MSWATAYIAKLQQGETVTFRPRGTSMVPLIHSGNQCTVVPYRDQELKKRDIVLCRVNGAQYLHLITGIRQGQVQISNNKGHVNGWIALDKVYGVLTHVRA